MPPRRQRAREPEPEPVEIVEDAKCELLPIHRMLAQRLLLRGSESTKSLLQLCESEHILPEDKPPRDGLHALISQINLWLEPLSMRIEREAADYLENEFFYVFVSETFDARKRQETVLAQATIDQPRRKRARIDENGDEIDSDQEPSQEPSAADQKKAKERLAKAKLVQNVLSSAFHHKLDEPLLALLKLTVRESSSKKFWPLKFFWRFIEQIEAFIDSGECSMATILERMHHYPALSTADSGSLLESRLESLVQSGLLLYHPLDDTSLILTPKSVVQFSVRRRIEERYPGVALPPSATVPFDNSSSKFRCYLCRRALVCGLRCPRVTSGDCFASAHFHCVQRVLQPGDFCLKCPNASCSSEWRCSYDKLHEQLPASSSS